MKITVSRLRKIIRETLEAADRPRSTTVTWFAEPKGSGGMGGDKVVSVTYPVLATYDDGTRVYEFLTDVSYSRPRGGGDIDVWVGASEGFFTDVAPGSLAGKRSSAELKRATPDESAPEDIFDSMVPVVVDEANDPVNVKDAEEYLNDYELDLDEAEAEARDPLGYRGMRRSDFT